MIRRMSGDFLDFIFPQSCVLCENRIGGDRFFCPECLDNLTGSMNPAVLSGHADFSHLAGPIHFDRVIVGWEYSPEIEDLVHRMKYQRGLRLARRLGRMLGEVAVSLAGADTESAVLIPVPLHRTRRRERGYNQSELLCGGLRESFAAPVRIDVLNRVRNTSTQTKLDAEARQKNVGDAFAVRRSADIEGRTILLVDDVSTTGSTMNGCARSLKDAGACEVIGLALARPVLDELY